MSKYTPNEFYVFEDHTSAQTNNVLVAAPGAGRRIIVIGLIFSTDGTGTCKLVEDPAGTPVQRVQTIYGGANGGISAPQWAGRAVLTENTALGFTSAGVTNHSVGVMYYIQ
jgi:hypothetical protein